MPMGTYGAESYCLQDMLMTYYWFKITESTEPSIFCYCLSLMMTDSVQISMPSLRGIQKTLCICPSVAL